MDLQKKGVAEEMNASTLKPGIPEPETLVTSPAKSKMNTCHNIKRRSLAKGCCCRAGRCFSGLSARK